jgi:putative cell wall-binding protein
VAGPLATNDGAPVQLGGGDKAPRSTMEEIQRLGPSRIVMVGGPVAVNDDVAATVEGTGAADSRVAGSSK